MRFIVPVLAFVLTFVAVQTRADVPVLQQAQASRLIYDIGVKQRDAVMVLAAASLRRGIALAPTNRTAEDGAEGGALLTWEDMIATAMELAAGDPALIGVIEDTVAARSKGVTSGPVYNIASIGPKRDDVYRAVPFNGRSYAEIYVEGKGPQDLNLMVRDAQGRLVCSDTDASAIAYCGWTPREAGEFSITVINTTSATTTYTLVTN